MKISAIVKCQLLDNDLLEMTKEAVSTIKPYVDELILVNQGSVVGLEWLKNTADVYIHNEVSGGFPLTAIQGMEKATGDYVFLLNNDIKFSGDWVTPLIEIMDEETAIVHPNCIEWGGKFYHGTKDIINGTPRDGLFFSAFLLNPKIYKEIGGWSQDYDFWGYDDWDYYIRTRKAGYKTILTNRVCYWHKGGATMNKIGREKYSEKNKQIFISKYGDPDKIDWSKI